MYKYYLSKQFGYLWRSDVYAQTFEMAGYNIYGPKFTLWSGAPRLYGLYEIPIEKAVEWAVKYNNLIVLKAICEDIIQEGFT